MASGLCVIAGHRRSRDQDGLGFSDADLDETHIDQHATTDAIRTADVRPPFRGRQVAPDVRRWRLCDTDWATAEAPASPKSSTLPYLAIACLFLLP
jgi:hypothetical protein